MEIIALVAFVLLLVVFLVAFWSPVTFVLVLLLFVAAGWFLLSVLPRITAKVEKVAKPSAEAPQLVGAKGFVTKTLRPVGVVEIDGQPFEGVTDGDFLQRGTLVTVVGLRGVRGGNWQVLVSRSAETEDGKEAEKGETSSRGQ